MLAGPPPAAAALPGAPPRAPTAAGGRRRPRAARRGAARQRRTASRCAPRTKRAPPGRPTRVLRSVAPLRTPRGASGATLPTRWRGAASKLRFKSQCAKRRRRRPECRGTASWPERGGEARRAGALGSARPFYKAAPPMYRQVAARVGGHGARLGVLQRAACLCVPPPPPAPAN